MFAQLRFRKRDNQRGESLMRRNIQFVCVLLVVSVCLLLSGISQASVNQRVNARSAILIDMESGSVLYEQDADYLIAPASITKILTLYLVFEAIKQGEVRLSDEVEVSRLAASASGSRMGLRAGTRVSLEELIKGIAVVSGNDACVAAAEHISGSVGRFVNRMNVKARELGMTRSSFMTPNGLPAAGQLTTARDIAKLSVAYLHRFPESLNIHSMQSYAYGRHCHHNANRLLGKCPGVDGLKTGFVCACGYNISATAKRNGVRILAVVMGARSPWVRCSEAEKLLEAGFRETGGSSNDGKRLAFTCGSDGSAGVCSGGTCKVSGVRKTHVKKPGKHVKQVAHSRTKGHASNKVALSDKKKLKTSAGKLTAKNCKTPSRHVSGKKKTHEAASVKTASATTHSSRSDKVRSAKSKKDETKTAAKKKNNKGSPQAHAMKKRAKG
jgi:D-alanyl-D-alanine carboxypeptidase (penicillin-binding protein 5/6)